MKKLLMQKFVLAVFVMAFGFMCFYSNGTNAQMKVGCRWTGMCDPINAQDYATKNYVDTHAGTVTTVGATGLSPLFNISVSNPTITPSITFSSISQAQNLVYASPSSGTGMPNFRTLVQNDLPNTTVFTSGTYSNPSWITALAWSKITGTPTILTIGGSNTNVQFNNSGALAGSALFTFTNIGGTNPVLTVINGALTQGTVLSNQFNITNGTGVILLQCGSSVGGNVIFKNRLNFPNATGNSGDLLSTDGIGNLSWITPFSIVGSSSDLTSQTTTTTLASYTTTALTTLRIGIYLNVTAISAGTVIINVTYTDENSVFQTLSIGVSSVTGINQTLKEPIIRCAASTITIVQAVFAGVSTVYDAGAQIEKLR